MNAWCGSGDFPGGGGGGGGGGLKYIWHRNICMEPLWKYALLEIVPSLNIVFEVSNQLWGGGGGGGGLEAQRLTPTHSIRSENEFYQMGIIHLLKNIFWSI